MEIRPGVWQAPYKGDTGLPDLILPFRGARLRPLRSDKG
jgi:hypothetical protein